ERETFHSDIAELEQQLSDQLSELPQWKRESSNALRQLNHDTIRDAINPLLQPLQEQYGSHADILSYLDELQEFLQRLVMEELRDEYATRSSLEDTLPHNVVAHRAEDSGAPVIDASHASFCSLFGRSVHASDEGALGTYDQRS